MLLGLLIVGMVSGWLVSAWRYFALGALSLATAIAATVILHLHGDTWTTTAIDVIATLAAQQIAFLCGLAWRRRGADGR